MTIQKNTNFKSRNVPPPNLSDDSGIESGIGVIRADVSQIAQVASSLSNGAEQGDFPQEGSSRQSEREQTDTTEARYSLALAEILENKRTQATQLEDRLMKQSQQQTERLSKLRQKPPRMLSLPSTKKIWKNELRKEANRLEQTKARLIAVREIRDGLGPLIPRLQEVAAAKLRATQPELARARDEARRLERAQIQHQGRAEVIREQEQKKSRSRSLDLSRKPT